MVVSSSLLQSGAFAHTLPSLMGPIHSYLLPKKNFSELWFSSKKWFSNHMANQMFETTAACERAGPISPALAFLIPPISY